MKPLEGLKVVELGTHVAAPMISRLLAEWGATTIKVEKITGEAYRTVGPVWRLPTAEENSPIIQTLNSNRQDISINLKDPEGKEILLRLLKEADVFVTNTRPQGLQKLGLDYDSIKNQFPRLIYALVTSYGLVGPDKDAPGFDSAAYWARGGMLNDWTSSEYIPAKPHPGFGDGTVAALLLSSILACLLRREKTGEGEFVTSSLYGGALWYNFHNIVEAQYPGHETPVSRYNGNLPLTPTYRSSDNISFFIIEQQWDAKGPTFLSKLGLDGIANDPKFVVSAEARKPDNLRNDCLYLEEAFATIPYAKIDEVCKELNMVHSYLCSSTDVLDDQQAWENGYLTKLELRDGSEMITPRCPIGFGGEDKPAQMKVAPLLGKNTREIMQGLGYTNAEINALTEKGAINTHGI